jgi:2-polyprenyl-3-methyl-5-hydroxy-6-metoxy-1,4-benzoquinol methylase
MITSDTPAQPNAPCPICGEQEQDPVIVVSGFRYVRCRSCQSVFLDPIPAPEVLVAQYQNAQYYAGGETTGYRNYTEMHKALAPHFRRRLHTLASALPAQGRLLDFGCADGFFLELARAAGWHITGVEVAQSMAEVTGQRLGIEVAQGLDVLAAKSFDAITLWDVIEHLAAPIAQLTRLRDCLRPGGVVMLSTPNAGHWQAQSEPAQWRGGYQPPAHVVLFNAASLALVLRTAGFERISVRGTAPLPPLPTWLRHVSTPLARALADGSARPWLVARTAWYGIRVLGRIWQRATHRTSDIFMTLEVVAFRP